MSPRFWGRFTPTYDEDVMVALRTVWAVMDAPAGKRMATFLPEMVARLRAFGELDLDVGTAARLCWEPLIVALINHPILDIGPGALGTARYPATEAHNILLRLGLDWGISGALLALSIFVIVYQRDGSARKDPAASAHLRGFATLARISIVMLFVTGGVQESISAVMSSHLTMLAVGVFAAEYIRHLKADQRSRLWLADSAAPG